MFAPILATKLYAPPPRPNAVARPRLLQKLDNGLQGKLTLVSAPAGFGKTTAVSQWLCTAERNAAWLSLDEADNDPRRFLGYLIAAIQKISPATGKHTQSELHSAQPPPLESLLALLLNEISATADALILVLDDYHVIDAKPVDDMITFMLEHNPPQLHLLITTREDPDLPLARLRARCQLCELRAGDLRFTSDEATTYMNQVMQLQLPARDINALETRTEGWIAGLQLAALSMQGLDDVSGFIKSFAGTHHFVLDYLLQEALQQQPQELQNFLLATSILERLSGPLCDAVMQDDSGQEMLERIEHANLFIIPLDNQRQWYRYHHLFADVLRARLMKTHAAQIPVLHRRASDWFAQHAQRPDAIRHALAGGDFERAAELCELAWPEMDRYIQSAPWLGWVQRIPEHIIHCRPVLLIHYAWALLDIGELEAAERHIQTVETLLADMHEDKKILANMVIIDQEQFQLLPASIASARAYSAQTLGDIPAAIEYNKQTLQLLPEQNQMQCTGASAMLGLCYCAAGNLELAYRTFSGSMEKLRKSGNADHAISGTFILADIRSIQGRLHDALQLYEQAIRLLPDAEPFPQGSAYLYLGMSKLQREWGNHDLAEQLLAQCETINNNTPLQLCHYRITLARARLREDRGDLDGALQLLHTAEKLFYRNIVPEFRPIGALQARIRIAQHKLGEAFAWAEAHGLSAQDEADFLREFEHITLVRLLIARYQVDRKASDIEDAQALAQRLLRAAEAGGRRGSMIEILLVQTLAHDAKQEIDQAIETLEKALALAQAGNYIQTFVDEGPVIQRLLSKLAARTSATAYTDKLLTAFAPEQRPAQPVTDQPATSVPIEPLSQRELEVLRLIAKGYSNRQISDKLYLALSSIKGHNQRIFAKLQVQRRTEAVARARELGLI